VLKMKLYQEQRDKHRHKHTAKDRDRNGVRGKGQETRDSCELQATRANDREKGQKGFQQKCKFYFLCLRCCRTDVAFPTFLISISTKG